MIPERKSPYNGEMIRNIHSLSSPCESPSSKCAFNYILDPPYPVRVGPVQQLLIEGLPGHTMEHSS